MFSDESVHTRFAGVDAPHSGNSDQLIAVRYDGVAATWQYSDGALWHNFAHVSSDHLIAQVDFGDTSIYDLGGQLPWGRFVHERARAERDAWDGDDLNTLYDAWHENVRAAHTLYTLARGDAYYATAVDLADGARTFALDVADEVYDHVIGSSHDQRAFQLRLADAVARYRRETAEAEYEYERDHGLANLNDDQTARDAAEQARNDAKADAEETYKERYADVDRWRRQDLAGSSLELARAIVGTCLVTKRKATWRYTKRPTTRRSPPRIQARAVWNARWPISRAIMPTTRPTNWRCRWQSCRTSTRRRGAFGPTGPKPKPTWPKSIS